MVSFGWKIFLLCLVAAVQTFFIAGLLYLLRFERLDNLGAYRIPSGDRPSPSKTLGSGDARLKSDRVSEALQALDQVSFQALCVESVKVIAAEIGVGATRPL